MKQPWDRLDGERSKAYYYFCLYRDLGIDRTINKLRAALVQAKAEIVPTKSRLTIISARNDWVARAEKYDDYLAEERRKGREKELQEMYGRHAEAAKKLVDSGLKRLEKELAEKLDISPAEARRRIVEGQKSESLARGGSGEKEELDVSGKLNIIISKDIDGA